jgi:hypothetical protein
LTVKTTASDLKKCFSIFEARGQEVPVTFQHSALMKVMILQHPDDTDNSDLKLSVQVKLKMEDSETDVSDEYNTGESKTTCRIGAESCGFCVSVLQKHAYPEKMAFNALPNLFGRVAKA